MRKTLNTKALVLATALAAAASQAYAQAIQTDPQGSSALLAGVQWLQGTLMGNVATAVAVMAVAAVGFMMLTAASTGATARPSSWAASSCSALPPSSAASAPPPEPPEPWPRRSTATWCSAP
jgi:type IV secretory pathway VirB2 component (pilin)